MMRQIGDSKVSSVASHRPGREMVDTGGTCVQLGVMVRDAVKSYGVGSRRATVLQGLNMSVKKGSIYGLLGASGCGKTTLLSCLVGRRSLNSGEILVLGNEPGSPNSGVPGPKVGYMPQELALYGHFTIKETLQYFGRIYNLKMSFVDAQVEFLVKLLDLPSGDRYVMTLSGGQQRRVSFAVAIFHEPELLILDEPTVGVDPVLRHSIWNHLISQSVDHSRTIIVTTHYIEEARQANMIGMMRSGRLLAEESPENLLTNYNLSSLEAVFLKLCMKDEGNDQDRQEPELLERTVSSSSMRRNVARPQQPSSGHDNMAFERGTSQSDISEIGVDCQHLRNSHLSQVSSANCNVNVTANIGTIPTVTTYAGQTDSTPANNKAAAKRKSRTFRMTLPSPRRLYGLIHKNYLLMFRNLGIFVFLYFLPAFQATIFNMTLGREPKGLKMGIVNEEVDASLGRVCNYTTDCAYSMLSCRYLRYIKDNIVQIPYDNVTDALQAGKDNEVWGFLHFGHNFTEEFELRQSEGDSANLQNIIRSRINVRMDSTNQQIEAFIEKWLLEGFGDFFKDFMVACGHEPEAGYIPIVFEDPMYGKKDTPYTEFMAAGLIISIIYFMGVSLTAGVFVSERKQGLLDRSLVAGVQMVEILTGYLVNQFTVMIGQTALVFLIMLLVFDTPCHGNLALAVLVTFLQGFVGMCFGLLIATMCEDEISALCLSMSSFLPALVISGVCWPIEGMPFYLRNIAYSMPMTYAVESLRCIFTRGWGVEHLDVAAGILISLGWIIGLLVLSLVVVRFRKYTS
ncbi:ABC transporter G family member 20 [Daphnia magna]|uniref:ABC transporter G family member 20 n=1 Tax=Daphnia magna TaxID=35525 RepID=UPI0006DECFCE|nr:ABC transporter G family member 20 [Daphnia magna]XP_045027937.1 ABC transporter G family member 20 [Daphnia magna]